MDTKTLEVLKYAAIITLTILVAIGGMAYFMPPKEVGAAVYGSNQYVDAVATTTRTTLAVGATTTMTVGILGSEAFDVNLCAVASSTGALRYRVFYSMGDPETAAASSTLTWFQSTTPTASSTSSGTFTAVPDEFYVPLTTSVSCFNVPHTGVGAKWVKVDMMGVATTSTVWKSLVPKTGL